LAYNPVSISLYSRYGIYPREPLYLMECPRQSVKKADDDSGLTSEQAENFQAVRKFLNTIDVGCIGYPREKNHEFLFSLPSYKCYVYAKHGKAVGYAYVAQNGRVGPVATVSEYSFGDVVESAIGFASQEEK